MRAAANPSRGGGRITYQAPKTFAIPELATAFMLTFARIGTLVMLMPGIGERMISARLRLGFALLLSVVLFPLTRTLLPASAAPQSALALLAGELAVGFMLGLATRMVVAALQTAGNIVAQQLGLAFAMTVDPAMGGQQAAVGNFLTLLGLTLIFAFDLHHLAIAAIRDSYAFLPPTGIPGTGDAAALAIKGTSRSPSSSPPRSSLSASCSTSALACSRG